MKKVSVLVVAVAVIAAMVMLLNHNKAKSEAKARSVAVRPFAVSVAPVAPQELSESLTLVGTISADREVTVASEAAGRITSVSLDLGAYKSAGSVLVTVDDELRRAAVSIAEVNRDRAAMDLKRYEAVQSANAIPDQQIDNARLAVKAAEAQLVTAQRQLRDTRTTAPFSGSVAARFVEVGAMVQPGTPIATLVDISRLKVELNVSEQDVFNLKIGDAVTVTTDVYPGVEFSGRVETIGPKGDEAHAYQVEISLPNEREHPLKAGMFGRVAFGTHAARTALTIPRAAIIGSVKEPQVYVVEKGVATLRTIVVGAEAGTNVEVLNGLRQGEQVVISGQNNLRDGMTVEIAK